MGMTTEGWIFLTLAWGVILTLISYCFYKVLKGNNSK
ncbi:MAG: hypothetical protein KatS3mg036_0737 [Ignavibacterium sp.]|nr:MAG: hypothetical protein KatS3mg037_0928 [Ignavibacterium sp.]GIV45919.1 MAG: hypothetical protein KatS3mg036_0737 [Ignavibacterium sp.]